MSQGLSNIVYTSDSITSHQGGSWSVTVGSALPAGTNAIGKLAANSGVDIGDVDITSVVPGTTATSLGKAEDATHTTGDTGVMALAVRKDTATALAGSDGDYIPLIVDSSGRLHVTGTISTGSGATDLGKAEDSSHTTGDVGVMSLAVRKDSAAALAGTDGDYIPLTTDSVGRLYTNPLVNKATTGSLTSGVDEVNHLCGGSGTAGVQLSGTFTGNVAIKGSTNGSFFYAIKALDVQTGAYADTVSGTGLWIVPCAGLNTLRIQRSGAGTGTVDVAVESSPGSILANGVVPSDGMTNPASNVVGSAGLLYNGSTWDLQRGNWETTTGDSGTKTATFNGATQTNRGAVGAFIYVLLGTVSGTSPTMAVKVQFSPDGGTAWMDVGPAATNLTATGNTLGIMIGPNNWSQTPGSTPAVLALGSTQDLLINAWLPRTWRLVYTIGGTTPSFALTGVYVSYFRG